MASKKPAQNEIEISLSQKTLRGIKREAIRGAMLASVLGFMYFQDPVGFGVVTYMIAFMLVIALTSHYVRRIMFSYLDMGKIANKADETPQSSAMVFLGVCLIIAASIFAGAQFLK